MRRLLAALLTLLCVTGCSIAPGQTNTAEQPEGIYLKGEFVPSSDYDPHDHTIDWINPCEEIPERVYAGGDIVEPFESDRKILDISVCTSRNSKGDLVSLTGGEEPIFPSLNHTQTRSICFRTICL